ncbi:hypothetical protein JL722_10955 [Aureococcus anophagefferens]|nr:hypothetical protein JL722_10955 [Aureococcus anophagefferens]
MMAFNLARILAAALLARAAAFDCATGRCPMGEGNDTAAAAATTTTAYCTTVAECAAHPDLVVPVSVNQVLKAPADRTPDSVRKQHAKRNPLKCVMMRTTETRDEFLMHEWGVFFEEVTASNLLKYDFDGHLVEPDGSRAPALPDVSNMGCLPVAAAIFKARPDAAMVVHIHPPAVMAVAGMEAGLLPVSQAAFFLHGQVSREGDLPTRRPSRTTWPRASPTASAMLLNHHGMRDRRVPAEAFFVAYHLNQACEVQVRTLGMNGGVLYPTEGHLRPQYADMMLSPDCAYDGSREWRARPRSSASTRTSMRPRASRRVTGPACVHA